MLSLIPHNMFPFNLNPKDVYASFTPISFFTRLFGIKSVDQLEGDYKTSKVRIGFALVNLTIFTLACCEQPRNARIEEISEIYDWCFYGYDVIVFARFVIIYLLSFKVAKYEIEVFELIDVFDENIKDGDKGATINASNRQAIIRSLILVVVLFIEHILEICIELLSFQIVTISIVLCRFIPSLVGILSKCYYHLWAASILDRFQIINRRLRVIQKKSKKQSKSTMSIYKFEKDVSKLVDLHKDLTGLTRVMNDIFQVPIICHYIILFIVIFSNGYYSVFMLMESKTHLVMFWITLIKNTMFLGFEFFVLIRPSMLLVREAQKTKDILCYVNVDPYDDTSHRLIIASIYELKENKLEISACRLFTVDYSSLFVIFATVANYVFVMLQFDDKASNGVVHATNITQQINVTNKA